VAFEPGGPGYAQTAAVEAGGFENNPNGGLEIQENSCFFLHLSRKFTEAPGHPFRPEPF
jgi:hypothetical protein